MDSAKFEAIFRDARVIDVDFSVWDERCRFLVIAMEETAPVPGQRLPIYFVDFLGVRQMGFAFHHWETPIVQGHFQWNVHDFKWSSDETFLRIALRGPRQFPTVEIVCKDVDVRSVDNDALDRLFPGWNQPGSPLVRPGIEELMKRRFKKGKPEH
jgi:hypothetical protein